MDSIDVLRYATSPYSSEVLHQLYEGGVQIHR